MFLSCGYSTMHSPSDGDAINTSVGSWGNESQSQISRPPS